MINLPDLPTKHKKLEADFGLVFRQWFEKNEHRFKEDSQFELKQTTTDYFYLNKLEPKQRKTYKGLIRLSVATAGTADYMYVKKNPLYIVIKYPKDFVIIPIEKMPLGDIKLSINKAKELSIC